MGQDPPDARIALDHAAEDERRRRERRVEEEADERHQPVVEHRVDAKRIGRMDVDHGAELVRLAPERLEPLVGERDVIDVAEDHRSR